jgi:hypothetical protein
MTWSPFQVAFPWIGGAAALVLLILLFATNLLRSDLTASRWRDPVWISWMATVAYLVHNVEEYGIDALGHRLSFPNALCGNMQLPPYPDCPMPPAFFVAVNVPLFWVVGPIAALLSRRHRLVGFALYSVISVNALVHVMAAVATGTPYNPGLLTAVLFFIPLTAWVAHTFFGRGRLDYRTMTLIAMWGLVLHVFLIAPMFLFVNGRIGQAALVWSQIVNAALLLLVFWLAEQWHKPRLRGTA